MKPPRINELMKGYRYIGGDPSQESSWEAAPEPRQGDFMKGYMFKGGDPSQESSWELPERTWGEFANDAWTALKAGTYSLGSSIAVLSDLMQPFNFLARQSGHMTPGKAVGDFLQDEQKFAREDYSDKIKALDRQLEGTDGFVNVASWLVHNPSYVFNAAMESMPGTVLAGGVGGKAAGIAGRVTAGLEEQVRKASVGRGAAWAGAASEAIQTFGDIFNNIEDSLDQNGVTDPQKRAAALAMAAPAMLSTLAFGRFGGSVEGKLFSKELRDAAGGGVAKTIVKDAFKEGLLEEMPQSAGEQFFTNVGERAGGINTPLSQGVSKAAATGLVVGGAVGGAIGGGAKVAQRISDMVITPEIGATREELDSILAGMDNSSIRPAIDPSMLPALMTGEIVVDSEGVARRAGESQPVRDSLRAEAVATGQAGVERVPTAAIPEEAWLPPYLRGAVLPNEAAPHEATLEQFSNSQTAKHYLPEWAYVLSGIEGGLTEKTSAKAMVAMAGKENILTLAEVLDLDIAGKTAVKVAEEVRDRIVAVMGTATMGPSDAMRLGDKELKKRADALGVEKVEGTDRMAVAVVEKAREIYGKFMKRATSEAHEAAVSGAVAAKQFVPPSVLTAYPDLHKQVIREQLKGESDASQVRSDQAGVPQPGNVGEGGGGVGGANLQQPAQAGAGPGNAVQRQEEKVKTGLRIKVPVQLESGETTEVEVDGNKALRTASRDVKRHEALAECLG